MGDIAPHREHLVRTIRDLEHSGEAAEEDNLYDARRELALIRSAGSTSELKQDRRQILLGRIRKTGE